MEPEPDPIDLSVLDPSRNPARWNHAISNVAARAIELRRLRRVVVRRGIAALAITAGAAVLLWLSAPAYDLAPRARAESADAVLDWAVRDVAPSEVLELGADHAY